MPSKIKRIWISETAFQALTREADRTHPLETGGVLVGYFADNGEPVIYAVIGPGPGAIHRRYKFVPDHSWQCRELDKLYEQSLGLWRYLGDWHTHPDGIPKMSWLDGRTLRRIAKNKSSFNPQPIMLIGGGFNGNWEWMAHQYDGERVMGLVTTSTKRTICLYKFSTAT